MPLYDFRCTVCNKEFIDVFRKIDDRNNAPTCCGPVERFFQERERAVISDDIPGGVWLENYGRHPIKVWSHTQRRRLLTHNPDGSVRRDKHGNEIKLVEQVRHVGVPGTDISPHTTRWDAVDAYTLENARILVSRPAAKGTNDSDIEEPYAPAIRPFSKFATKQEAIEMQQLIKESEGGD